jgi:hypothetical protein
MSGYLLRGQGIDPGAGAPSRAPQPTGSGVPVGPNATQYQRLVNVQRHPPTAVFEPTRYVRTIRLGGTLSSTATVSAESLVLLSPDTYREILLITNLASSSGTLILSFDEQASPSTAYVQLAAGGTVLFDTVVPQGDVHIGIAAGAIQTINFNVVYANSVPW